MKTNLFKELLESIKEARILHQVNKEIKEHRKVKKVEPEEVIKSYTSIDKMFKDLNSNKGWTIFDYIISYWHRYFWNFVSDIPLRVKTFIQRGIRGWSDSDTWEFDYYLAKVISEGIRHLLKYDNSAWSTKDLKAIKEIAYTFETIISIEEDHTIYIPSEKFTWKEYKKAKKFCKKMNEKYNDNYKVMTKREIIRFEKGFQLFQKYFFYLWD